MGYFMTREPFHCRSCRSAKSELVLDLGLQPLANNLLRPEDLTQPEPHFPLRVFVCTECWLLQLTDLVPPVELFTEYLYFSSFSDTMLRHARAAAERHLSELHLGPQSLVVEMASNDGYLLQNFHRAGVPCLGIEPAANIAKVAREKGIETWTEFFGEPLARRVVEERGAADLILGNNVFAHAPDINDFTAGLAALLKPEGRAVLEFPYGVELVEQTEFDTIYHEHVFYFTLTPLVPLFRRHGLEIFHVERLPIHGGSLRLHAGRTGSQPMRASVVELLGEERAKGVTQPEFYRSFAAQVRQLREDLRTKLFELKRQGQTLAAYGASAKGSTLLNYCALGREMLDFVADRSTYKQGRLTPGTHLPIVATEELARRQPDYTLLLTWNFAEEILRQQQAYREAGGRFIVPVPEVRVL
jgi:SAM-dependent methyltransferase